MDVKVTKPEPSRVLASSMEGVGEVLRGGAAGGVHGGLHRQQPDNLDGQVHKNDPRIPIGFNVVPGQTKGLYQRMDIPFMDKGTELLREFMLLA